MLEAGFEDCGGISLRCRLCRMFVSSVCVGVAGISFEGERRRAEGGARAVACGDRARRGGGAYNSSYHGDLSGKQNRAESGAEKLYERCRIAQTAMQRGSIAAQYCGGFGGFYGCCSSVSSRVAAMSACSVSAGQATE